MINIIVVNGIGVKQCLQFPDNSTFLDLKYILSQLNSIDLQLIYIDNYLSDSQLIDNEEYYYHIFHYDYSICEDKYMLTQNDLQMLIEKYKSCEITINFNVNIKHTDHIFIDYREQSYDKDTYQLCVKINSFLTLTFLIDNAPINRFTI